MSKLTSVLILAVIVLVAAVGFLVGQRTNSASTKSAENLNTKAEVPRVIPGGMMKPVHEGSGNLRDPVIVGRGGPNLDACGSNGRVVGLNPNGDNFLAVKSSPRLNARRIDKLGPSYDVYVCDGSKDRKWLGIVYEPDGQPSANCGVTSSVATPRPYAGRCQSGWVDSKYIEVYAG